MGLVCITALMLKCVTVTLDIMLSAQAAGFSGMGGDSVLLSRVIVFSYLRF